MINERNKVNKIAIITVNLAPGDQVTELEVFFIRLNDGQLGEAALSTEKNRIIHCSG